MSIDGQKSSEAAKMNLEEVTAARRKREWKKTLAQRFLMDPRFRQQHLEQLQLQRRAQGELLSSAPASRVKKEDMRQSTEQQAEEVAVREVLDAQHQRRREAQARVVARAEEARTWIQPLPDVRVGSLAETIRLRKTGMLPPPAERNGDSAEADARFEELKKHATGILQQRMETARLAEDQERQRRIVTFPERSAKAGR